MKNANTAVAMPRHEFDYFSQLLDTIQSQAEMIARLTSERNERMRREDLADQQRQKVFRIPIRS